jgi:hypothetical protein
VLLAIVDFYDFLLHQPADFETGLRLEHSSAASNIGKTHQTSRFALPSLTLDFAGSDSLPLPYTISSSVIAEPTCDAELQAANARRERWKRINTPCAARRSKIGRF